MRHHILTAAALSVAAATTSFANDSVVPPAPGTEQTTETTVQSEDKVIRGQSQRVVRRSRSNDTFFGRMMELERRKNAWLRRTFLNR